MSESDRDLIAEGEKVLDEKGWTTGHLVHPVTGGHCSLGAIGYAKWGDAFDATVHANRDGARIKEQAGYDMLASDPETREAVLRLANRIRQASAKPLLSYNPATGVQFKLNPADGWQRWGEMGRAFKEVAAFNDLSRQGTVLSVFKSARRRIEKVLDKFRKEPNVKVEYAPEGVGEKEKEVEKQEG